MRASLLRLIALVAAVGAAACVHQSETPALTGPSGLARTLRVTATPDRITQDGASQASVAAQVIGPDGRSLSGVTVRLDMEVAGALTDYGTLSARTVVTGSDGVARAVYTAPPPPTGGVQTVSSVNIRATLFGTDLQTSNPEVVVIGLIPPGVIIGGGPTARFDTTPGSPIANSPTVFDGSASAATLPASLVSFKWDFGDGGTGTGRVATHSYANPGTYIATLTVTDDRGVPGIVTHSIVVGVGALPKVDFSISPSTPLVGQSIFFNADASLPGTGHTLTTFNWNFGDGGTATGFQVTHTFATPGTFTVSLTVADESGQRTTLPKQVTVTGSTGTPTANFTFSPQSPVGVGVTVQFGVQF